MLPSRRSLPTAGHVASLLTLSPVLTLLTLLTLISAESTAATSLELVPQLVVPREAAEQPDAAVPEAADFRDQPAASSGDAGQDVFGQSSAAKSSSGYWVVATHQSPQSFDDQRPVFRPVVLRFDEGPGYRHSSFAEFCQSLQPGIPVCVATHGAFVDWPSVCGESRCVWKWLQKGCPGHPLQLVYFAWPSDQKTTGLLRIDFGVISRRASRNGFYLADLIRHIPQDCPVSLVGHSLGTRVIASALHLMGGGAVEDRTLACASCTGRRIRVVFAASAIDHDWLNPGERFGNALCCTECLLNLRNRRDAALCVYPLRRPFSSRALGHSGFTRSDLSRLHGCQAKLTDLDVSAMIGARHLWPEYFCRPELAVRIRSHVFFETSAWYFDPPPESTGHPDQQ